MSEHTVAAEIAGVVFSVNVSVGDRVEAEQALVVIESMKMHIPVEAHESGVVTELLVGEGETVAEGQALVRVES